MWGVRKKTTSIISLIVIDWGHPEYRKKCRKKRINVCSGTRRAMNRDMNMGFVGKWVEGLKGSDTKKW